MGGVSQSVQTAAVDSRVKIDPLSSANRKAKPCMAKRSGQAGTVVKKGLKWHLRYLHDTPEGRVRKSIPLGEISELTKTEAKRLGAQWLAENGINTRQYLERATAVPTFDSALERWKGACLVNFKPSGRDSARYSVGKHIEPRFRGMLLEKVDKQAVQLWINDLKGAMAPKTARNNVKYLKMILNWSDVGTRDWKLRLPELPEDEQRWFTAVEVRLIIDEATGQYKVLFRLAYATGMRAGELFGLHIEDFDFVLGTVTVRRSTYRNTENSPKTKSSKGRKIFLDDVTVEEVKALVGDRTTGRVFMTKNGTPLKDGDVCRYVLKPICKKLGIPFGGMHAFRHGRVSRMDEMGVSEKVRLTEVGHTTLEMNQKYTHVSDERRKQIAQRLAI